MKTLQLLLLLIIPVLPIFGVPSPDADVILAEGQHLYRLEKGSWYGTDNFLEHSSHLRDSIKGYLSYETDDHLINTIFYGGENEAIIFTRFTFDSIPGPNPLKVDMVNSAPTAKENSLIALRQSAMEQILANEDNFFSFYENTSFNVIPIINPKKNIVYVLTGPQEGGYILIGNDYYLEFDKDYDLKTKTKIHNTMIKLPYQSDKEKSTIEATYHSHVNSEAIDPTDICTMLLYREFLSWDQHIVISSKYVSIFNVKDETLAIITKKAWEKISKHQKKIKQ